MKSGMTSMHTFISPKEIVWGRGSVQSLEKTRGEKALIITDKSMVKVGAVEKVEHYLKKAGISSMVFDGVEPEFVIDSIMRIVEQHKDFAPDAIVGLGGGSVIDAAKAFRVFYEHPDMTVKDIFPASGPPQKVILPSTKTTYTAIPTTSGTGSEMSFVFVASALEKNAKRAVGSPFIVPDKAILDPDFTDSMPRTVQIDSGFDALSHAIPAYYSNFRNDFSKAYAIQAIRLIMQNLAPASEGDKEAKEHMHYAASFGGTAFTNSGLGVEHHLSHIYGAKFHIPHGRACGLALTHAIRFNADAAKDAIMEIVSAIGYSGNDINQASDYLVNRVSDLQKQLGVPETLKEYGISESLFKAELPDMMADFNENPMPPPLISNPQKCTTENMEKLFTATYYG